MALSPDLTVRETALLAGVSAKTVEKALEAGVLRAVAAPARFRGGAARFLPLRAVAFFHALDAADLADLPLRHKRALWDQLTTLKPARFRRSSSPPVPPSTSNASPPPRSATPNATATPATATSPPARTAARRSLPGRC